MYMFFYYCVSRKTKIYVILGVQIVFWAGIVDFSKIFNFFLINSFKLSLNTSNLPFFTSHENITEVLPTPNIRHKTNS